MRVRHTSGACREPYDRAMRRQTTAAVCTVSKKTRRRSMTIARRASNQCSTSWPHLYRSVHFFAHHAVRMGRNGMSKSGLRYCWSPLCALNVVQPLLGTVLLLWGVAHLSTYGRWTYTYIRSGKARFLRRCK